MHKGEEVAAHLAFVGVAGKDLLRVARIDRDFPPAGVIAGAAERTIEADLSTRSMHFERDAAFRRCFLQGGFCLEVIDAPVLALSHRGGEKKGGYGRVGRGPCLPGSVSRRAISPCCDF